MIIRTVNNNANSTVFSKRASNLTKRFTDCMLKLPKVGFESFDSFCDCDLRGDNDKLILTLREQLPSFSVDFDFDLDLDLDLCMFLGDFDLCLCFDFTLCWLISVWVPSSLLFGCLGLVSVILSKRVP